MILCPVFRDVYRTYAIKWLLAHLLQQPIGVFPCSIMSNHNLFNLSQVRPGVLHRGGYAGSTQQSVITHMYVFTFHKYVSTYVHTYIQYIHTYVCTYIRTYSTYIHTYVHREHSISVYVLNIYVLHYMYILYKSKFLYALTIGIIPTRTPVNAPVQMCE